MKAIHWRIIKQQLVSERFFFFDSIFQKNKKGTKAIVLRAGL